jgi:hypothetical protein
MSVYIMATIGFTMIFLSLGIGGFLWGCSYVRCGKSAQGLVDLIIIVCFTYCAIMGLLGFVIALGW